MNEFNRKNVSGDDVEDRNTFDFTEILSVVWRRKWLIIIPLIIVTAVTFAGSYLITPEYEASTIVYIGETVKLSGELQRLLGDGPRGYQSDRDRRLELQSLQNEITSSPYIFQLVEELNLDEDPDLERIAGERKSQNPGIPLEKIKFDMLLGKLRDKILISYAGKDQIQITTQSTNPERAREMAEELARIFISEKMKQELGSVRLSQDFSYEQLAKYEKDLQDKIKERTEFEKEFNKIRLDDAVTSDENRKLIRSEIEGARLEIEEKKAEERKLISQLNNIPNGQIKLSESASLERLQKEVDSHIGSIANLMLRFNWSAPEILNYKTRLFNLIDEINLENQRLVDRQFSEYSPETRNTLVRLFNVREELDVLYSRVNSLQLALNDLNQKVDLIPEYQAQLDQLDREVNAARDLRDKFREQQESSQISQALLRESKYKIVEPAKTPLAPFKPKRKQIIALGFLLGLVIGGAAALIVELLDKSFRKIEDVEEALGLPVIGVVPNIDTVRKLKIRK